MIHSSPSTSITIQDLRDTLRVIERYPWNMSHAKLISSAGKEDLEVVSLWALPPLCRMQD